MTASEEELFPPADRVIYDKAPLIQVAFQLNFPPILRIEAEVPSAFQDRIRGGFPLLHRVVSPPLPNLPPEVAQALAIQIGSPGFHFISEDRKLTVSISNQSFSYSSQSYKRWESFREQYLLPLSAFFEIYQPAFFNRIGLRYNDFIVRERLGLKDVSWSKLLRREILGELSIDLIEKNLIDCRRVLRVNMPDHKAQMVLQHGIGRNPTSEEKGYLFDFDFSSSERTNPNEADHVLNVLHEGAGRAFRWCITDTLHGAMEPIKLDRDAVG